MSETGQALASAEDLLTECDREPIHIPGSIQPHGCLVICRASDWSISHVSRSIETFFDARPEAVLDRPAATLFGEDGAGVMRRLLDGVAAPGPGERFFRVSSTDWSQAFDIAVHLNGDRIEVEFEPSFPAAEKTPRTATPLGLVKAVTSRLSQTEDFRSFCDIAARQLKVITGFDRVMVYRFAEDGSGEVIAEAKRPDMEPFLGLHYPATDIPQQARRLYVENPIRAIADVEAEPSPVLAGPQAGDAPVDMTFIGLRSVSPVHIQYLKNMGVGASMSLSILKDGELWGLFACHHDGAKIVDAEARAACELLAQLFSLQIETRENADSMSAQRERRHAVDSLRDQIADPSNLGDAFREICGRLDRLIEIDGVACRHGEDFDRFGSTPGEQILRRISEAAPRDTVWATDCIAEALPGSESDDAAGVMTIPVGGEEDAVMLLFRRELARTVTWAGRSTKADPGESLTPRKSFEAWTEVVRNRSLAWSQDDRGVGEALRALLMELAIKRSDLRAQLEQAARERQELLIAELNHRVKNILSLVRALARGGKREAQSVDDFVAELFGRLDALSAAHDQAIGDAGAALPLERLLTNELLPYRQDSGPTFKLSGPPVLIHRRAVALAALAFHEMATNAAKYGAFSTPTGLVDVTWTLREDGALSIDWVETGGPSVTPPGQKGFGSSLIERTWREELKGACDVAFGTSGFTACLTLPADTVLAPEQADADPLAAPLLADLPAESGRPESFVALLVEDSAIIALDLDDLLREAGASDVVHVSTVADGLKALERTMPDFALLDVNLGSESSFAIAEKLYGAGVPFAFSTGYGEEADIANRFQGVRVLKKPFGTAEMEAALDAAFASAGKPG